MLADMALGRARWRGCRRVYLLTESASDFFAEKFGFRVVQLSMVDAIVVESSQFRTASPNATAMVLDLPIDGWRSAAADAASSTSRGASPSRRARSCARERGGGTRPIASAPRSTS